MERAAKEWQYWDVVHRIEVTCSILIIFVALTGIVIDIMLTSKQYDISALIPHSSLLLTWVSITIYIWWILIVDISLWFKGRKFIRDPKRVHAGIEAQLVLINHMEFMFRGAMHSNFFIARFGWPCK